MTMIEIERKFLLKNESWRNDATAVIVMKQGYLCTDKDRTIRVRLAGRDAFLTIKGASTSDGASRPEFEYQIPVHHADELFKMCSSMISKTRYYANVGRHVWEIDEYHDENVGLFTAEIELKSVDEEFVKPDWVGDEVTSDFKYSNSNLSLTPFTKW
jgi:CYTH domain-containing protein